MEIPTLSSQIPSNATVGKITDIYIEREDGYYEIKCQ